MESVLVPRLHTPLRLSPLARLDRDRWSSPSRGQNPAYGGGSKNSESCFWMCGNIFILEVGANHSVCHLLQARKRWRQNAGAPSPSPWFCLVVTPSRRKLSDFVPLHPLRRQRRHRAPGAIFDGATSFRRVAASAGRRHALGEGPANSGGAGPRPRDSREARPSLRRSRDEPLRIGGRLSAACFFLHFLCAKESGKRRWALT